MAGYQDVHPFDGAARPTFYDRCEIERNTLQYTYRQRHSYKYIEHIYVFSRFWQRSHLHMTAALHHAFLVLATILVLTFILKITAETYLLFRQESTLNETGRCPRIASGYILVITTKFNNAL